MNVDYVQRILNSRVYEVARETPLDEADVSALPCRTRQGRRLQFVGQSAQGVALSVKKLGVRAVVVMPATTPSIKVSDVKAYGASVILRLQPVGLLLPFGN